MFNTYASKKKKRINNLYSQKKKYSSENDYRNQIIKNYNLSGLRGSLSNLYLNISSSINFYNQYNDPKQLNLICKKIIQFIQYELLNRYNEPTIDFFRLASIYLCIPHLLNDSQSKQLSDWPNLKDTIVNKIKENKKLSIIEKINTPFELLIVYSLYRCQNEYKIIIIPISVKTSSYGHSNLLIIDFRLATKKFEDYYYKLYIPIYLFEPNGEKFSIDNGINVKIEKIINHANQYLDDFGSKFYFKNLEIIGGDHGGLQTLLGEKYVSTSFWSSSTVTHQKGYPICGAIGFWLIYMWLYNDSNASIPEFINDQISKIRSSENYKDELKEEVFEFIEDVKDYQYENYKYQMEKTFKKNLSDYIKQESYISDFYHQNLNEYSINIKINMKYDIKHFDNQINFSLIFKNYNFKIQFT